ncbi:MopE-related protein [Sandaracinus amylolyticus]|nr:MopE-related protein [Sandaracinus amylolyticus]
MRSLLGPSPLVPLFVVLLAACGGPSSSPPEPDASSPPDDDAGEAPECTSDVACDDDLFCNGAERCVSGACTSGSAPCDEGDACDEETDACLDPCDLDADADDDGRDAIACGGDDCDDGDRNRFPGNPEVCDAADHDEDCDPRTFGVRDGDGDGFPDAACCNDAPDTRHCGSDCDDTRAAAHRGATDSCNGLDDDCDGLSDEGALRSYYPDDDGDGYGREGATPVMACNAPARHVEDDATDCDDTVRLRNPAATELCDGIDNNCDGATDEAGSRTYYRDSDGDGYGDPGTTVTRLDCVIPSGHVALGNDCRDGDADIHPGATERCDRIDSDCTLPGAAAGGEDLAEDGDRDGHAPLAATCTAGFPKDDCNDADRFSFLGAPEVCDGRDNDCDGTADPQPAMNAWCGVGYACDGGTCEPRRTIEVGPDDEACALEGTAAYCWGANDEGQLGDGTTAPRPGAVAVSGGFAFEQLGVGPSSSCGVRSDGALLCWGSGASLGEPEGPDRLGPSTPMPGTSDVVEASLRYSNGCLRLRNGRVRCWGNNGSGQLGAGAVGRSDTPIDVIGIDDAVAVDTGGSFACARRRDGTVWCWGAPSQLGRGPTVGDTHVPGPVMGLSGVRQLDLGSLHACALLATGEVRCWGSGSGGLIDGTISTASAPRTVAVGCDVAEIAAGSTATCAVCTDGHVRCWGSGLPVGDGVSSGVGRGPLTVAGIDDAVEIAMGHAACVRRATGDVVCWGERGSPVVGDGGQRFAAPVAGISGATAIAAGAQHGCAIVSGAVRCWGASGQGRLGVPAGRPAWGPVDAGVTGASAIALGWRHSCALRGGEVWCWGDNAEGELGDGTLVVRSTAAPVVGGLGTVTSVDAALGTSCATESDGDVFCWGDGGSSFLPGGVDSATPIEVAIDTGVLALGSGFACGVQPGGSWCWGSNVSGQLGRGDIGGSNGVPMPVMGLASAPAHLAVGSRHACVATDAGVSCWGENGTGQLGDGGTVDAARPTTGPALTGLRALAAGSENTCAIVADGTVRCWGAGEATGDGTGAGAVAPVSVVGVTGATALAAGWGFNCALVTGGRVMCWGDDDTGQLGRGVVIPVRGLP